MGVSIDIRPHSDSLRMYGEPDKSTAYSLSGNICISLSPSFSLFERQKTARLLLQSLVIDFEGQCELITQEIGYAPYRLCHVSEELITGEALEISRDGREDMQFRCAWNIAFNLVISGWLPPSSVFGDHEAEDAGTRYALYATAKFLNIDDGPSSSWFSSCLSPFRSRICVVSAPRCDITLHRFISTFMDDPWNTSTIDYMVYAEPQKDVSTSSIPCSIISKIRTMISVPEYIDATTSSFPIRLRLRTKDLPETECNRLRITDFSVDVEQSERYRDTPSSLYKAIYPLPPLAEQPPRKPLRNPHPFQTLYELGLGPSPPTHNSYTRTISLLSSEASGHYALTGDGYVFTLDTAPEYSSTWFSIKTHVSFEGGKGTRKVHESGHGPLFSVSHRLRVSLNCTYDLTEGEKPERAAERLQFQIPLRFARIMPSCPAVWGAVTPSVLSYLSGHSPSCSIDSLSGSGSSFSSTAGMMPAVSLPYAQSLPAYSQLFDANGERKIDYSVPLPFTRHLPLLVVRHRRRHPRHR